MSWAENIVCVCYFMECTPLQFMDSRGANKCYLQCIQGILFLASISTAAFEGNDVVRAINVSSLLSFLKGQYDSFLCKISQIDAIMLLMDAPG
jgi:hypothetical protein